MYSKGKYYIITFILFLLESIPSYGGNVVTGKATYINRVKDLYYADSVTYLAPIVRFYDKISDSSIKECNDNGAVQFQNCTAPYFYTCLSSKLTVNEIFPESGFLNALQIDIENILREETTQEKLNYKLSDTSLSYLRKNSKSKLVLI